ncbi:hypothetical protein ACP70R_043626 [Stipagrostis hirtigluma subsp. patula]
METTELGSALARMARSGEGVSAGTAVGLTLALARRSAARAQGGRSRRRFKRGR